MARAFRDDVTIFVSEMGPAAAKALAEEARKLKSEVESDQQGRRGVQPLTLSYIDGRPDDNFSDAKPESVILLNWDYRAEIIKAAFEELKIRAPVSSGHYRDSFVALLDGAGLSPLQVPSASQLDGVAIITITNPVPYARRLEVAVTKSGRAFVKQVEPHIVESVMRALKAEFAAVAKIDFTYVDLENAHVATTNIGNRGHRRDRGKGVAIRYPAITIERF